MRSAPLLIALTALLAACGGEAESGGEGRRPTHPNARIGGGIVSTVDGSPITVDEVALAASRAGVSPAVALRRLQDELLLAGAAEASLDRTGARELDGREVERVVRQALVQAYLEREVEREETLDRVALEARVDADPNAFVRAERRRVLLVTFPDREDARAQAERLHQQVVGARDPSAALDRAATEMGLTVEVEPPVARDASVDPSYLAAIFEPEEVGASTGPFRTRFGWHVGVVVEIEEARAFDRERALSEVRAAEVARIRGERIERQVRELAARHGVTVHPEAIARAATLHLPDLPSEDTLPRGEAR